MVKSVLLLLIILVTLNNLRWSTDFSYSVFAFFSKTDFIQFFAYLVFVMATHKLRYKIIIGRYTLNLNFGATIIAITFVYPIFQSNSLFPTESTYFTHIQQLPHCPIRLRAVERDLAPKTHDFFDHFSELEDRYVFARSYVYVFIIL